MALNIESIRFSIMIGMVGAKFSAYVELSYIPHGRELVNGDNMSWATRYHSCQLTVELVYNNVKRTEARDHMPRKCPHYFCECYIIGVEL